MSKSFKHLIFFDGECGLCHRSVLHILSIDRKKIFFFSPLNGNYAKELLSKNMQKLNSLVLIERFEFADRKIWIHSKAVFRIYWLLGGKWKIIGFFSFFPSFLGDWVYKYFAKHRHHLSIKKEHEISKRIGKNRFFP